MKGLRSYLALREDSPSLNEFLYAFAKIVLFAVLFMELAEIIGIPITSFLVIFEAAGLAIGLALQESL